MARTIPADRIARLVEVATRVFIEHGYRQTRMDDVAEALGVAKGTLYLYVESKDALFDLVIRSADRPLVAPELPVRTPERGATLAHITRRLVEGQELRALTAPRAKLAAIVGELFDRLHANRVAIKLVDRAARDVPELGRVWFGGTRRPVVERLATHLARGIAAGELRRVEDPAIAARFVLETCAFWAVHRHWDAPQEIAEDRVRASVIDLVCAAIEEHR